MKIYLWMGLSLVVLSISAFAETNEVYLDPLLKKYIESTRDKQQVEATEKLKKAAEDADAQLKRASKELREFDLSRLESIRKEIAELEKKSNDPNNSEAMRKAFARQLQELKGEFAQADRSLTDTNDVISKADEEFQLADAAFNAAMAADKAIEEKKLAMMAQAIRNMKLMDKFDDKLLEGMEMSGKLQAIERKFDQLVIGAYVRDKMGRSMAAVMCKAGEVCDSNLSEKDRRDKIDKMLDKTFYSPEGEWGRNREGGKTH